MNISISESGMMFGPFAEEEVYQIEKSNLHQEVDQGAKHVKTVEFILKSGVPSLQFVEAKSSSPRPAAAGGTAEKFDGFIEEICDKFLHSLNLYCSAVLKRHGKKNDLPLPFREMDYSQTKIIFVLVIHGHRESWLRPISEALRKRMAAYLSIWEAKVTAINEREAVKRGLIRNP